MEKFKGLIFDFNGVLLLDQELHEAIWKKTAFEITGRRLSDEEFKNVFHGRTNKGVLEYLFGSEIEPRELQRLATKKELLYQEVARGLGSEYRLAPGAPHLLDTLRQRNIPFTIATSSPKMNVGFFNEMLHLDTWFDMEKVVNDDGTFPGKTAPDIYLKAANILSLKPEDCVVIEDARSGIAAAYAAGIGYILAIGPKQSHASLQALPGVNEVVERLDEVDVARLF